MLNYSQNCQIIYRKRQNRDLNPSRDLDLRSTSEDMISGNS